MILLQVVLVLSSSNGNDKGENTGFNYNASIFRLTDKITLLKCQAGFGKKEELWRKLFTNFQKVTVR